VIVFVVVLALLVAGFSPDPADCAVDGAFSFLGALPPLTPAVEFGGAAVSLGSEAVVSEFLARAGVFFSPTEVVVSF
jgi:hypothetical protein